MLTKCIGIISNFSTDYYQKREDSENFFYNLSVLNEYFKCPLVIVANNWDDNMLPKIKYTSNVLVYSFKNMNNNNLFDILRSALLYLDYDCFIIFDTKEKICTTKENILNYFKIIDKNYNWVGVFNNHQFSVIPAEVLVNNNNAKNIDEYIKGIINNDNDDIIYFDDNLITIAKNLKLSIIIPVYNREKLIVKALDSIPAREDIEVIVVNDGSTDNTLSVLNNYRRLDLKIITYDKNKGPGAARNEALSEVSGKYVTFLDSDDWYLTDSLNIAVNNLSNNNNVDIHWFKNKLSNGGVWRAKVFQGAFVRSSLVKGIKFTNKFWGEDKDFTKQVLMQPHSEITYKYQIYVYNYRPRSADTLTYKRLKENGGRL